MAIFHGIKVLCNILIFFPKSQASHQGFQCSDFKRNIFRTVFTPRVRGAASTSSPAWVGHFPRSFRLIECAITSLFHFLFLFFIIIALVSCYYYCHSSRRSYSCLASCTILSRTCLATNEPRMAFIFGQITSKMPVVAPRKWRGWLVCHHGEDALQMALARGPYTAG